MKQFDNLGELNTYINAHPENIESVDIKSFTVKYKDLSGRRMMMKSEEPEESYDAYIVFEDSKSYETFKSTFHLVIDFDFKSIKTIRTTVTMSEFLELRNYYNINLIELYDVDDTQEVLGLEVNGEEYSDSYNWAIVESGIITMWNRGYTGAGIKIAVIDTAFRNTDFETVPLVENIVFYDGTNHRNPKHGDYVIGAVGARLNNKLSVGSAPDSLLYGLETGLNRAANYEAFQWCIDNEMDFVNCSFGTAGRVIPTGSVEDLLINAMHDNGVILVAAAGNREPSHTVSPANHPKAIAVGGVSWENGDFKQMDGYINEPWITFEFAAENVVTSILDSNRMGTLTSATGTSLASPLFVGFMACLKQEFPTWSKDELVAFIKERSVIPDGRYGHFPYYYKHIRGIESIIAKIKGDGTLLIKGTLIENSSNIKFSKEGNLEVSNVSSNHNKVSFNKDGSIKVNNIIEKVNI